MTSEALALCSLQAIHFYRADYAVARCLSVCLSVRPSVTHRYSVEMAKYHQIFYHLVAKPFESFHTKSYDNIPTDAPVTGHRMQVKYEKIAIFDQYSLYFGNDTR